MPTILTKRSNTPGAVPATADLTNAAGGAELAVNTADKRLFTINSSSAVVEIGTNPSSLTVADLSATVLRAGSATITNLIGNSLTISSGTANGVLYLNGSKVATSGSALTFDGTLLSTSTFRATSTTDSSLVSRLTNEDFQLYAANGVSTSASGIVKATIGLYYDNNIANLNGGIQFTRGGAGTDGWMNFIASGSEQMRLTSTGLGIGTSSPATKLHVVGTGSQTNTLQTPVSFYATTSGTAANGFGTTIELGAEASDGSTYAQTTINSIWTDATAATRSSALTFATRLNAGSLTERLRIDASGNLGLGVTPSAWSGSGPVFQTRGAALFDFGSDELRLGNNLFYNGSDFIYRTTNPASYYGQFGGSHRWYNAPSGTAGNTITFTQAMTLDASGNLYLGATSGARGGSATRQFVKFGSGQAYLELQSNSTTSTGDALMFSDGSTGNYGLVGYSHNDDALFFYTAQTERARITAAGELLLGTTTDSGAFILQVAGDALITGGNALCLRGASSYISSPATDVINFATASTERARITSGGDLCINTTLSEGPAKVTSVSTTSGTACYSARNSAGAGSTFFSFINNNDTALIGTITNNGNTATAYNTTSDARLKENIAPADDAGSVVDAIQIVKHDWKVGGHVRYGVIAQDLHEVAPEAVAVGDGDDVDELKRPWGVDYSKLVPMLVKEIQSLRARVAALEGA